VRVTATEVDGIAVNRDISAGGMLIALSARLELGAAVEVRFSVPTANDGERVLRGKVVRIEDNTEDPDGMWPYRMAVAFDDTDPDLIPVLENAVNQIAKSGL
jgi:hypothetical protein